MIKLTPSKLINIKSTKHVFTIILSTFVLLLLSINISAQNINMKLLSGLKPRSIGPAGMSGRVTSIDVVLKNPDIIYAGTASGGLWRSTSGGIKWEPIFDKQPVSSIGAVRVDRNIPDIIWVGTGEGNPRNSQSSGNGIYKSMDGGKTWKHLGLEKTKNIHRIIIDPRNSDVVYVAALGNAWSENSERGIYKTIDGGKTWKKILFVNSKTGCADLVLDSSNPNKLVAAMWQYRRWPWFFESGGEGSGIYITFDGGVNWVKRTGKEGLPKGELGRIGLAISKNKPSVVYALIEAKKNALYRSDDGGFKWNKVSEKNIGNRPFYYADIYVDPTNENRLYNLYSVVTVSEDGGKTFKNLIPYSKVHPDHHAWWINPNDANFILDGNDGGMAISRDAGKSWRFIGNLPLAQFYHINVDNDKPYHVYGGMQDNGSWVGPSRVYRYGGITNAYWEEVGFGDGFDVIPDPDNSRYGYAMYQGGHLFRYDRLTGNQPAIKPVHPDGIKLRFNWNAGIAQDPFTSSVIYIGSQFLHKSSDRGHSWKIISPDLTTNDPEKQKQFESGGLTYDVTEAENYTTITCVTPSSLKKGVIWVGTDDGNIQLTTDGGKNWKLLNNNIEGLPEGAWVTQIKASVYNEEGAFAVINNYRKNDWKPYVFKTDNYGESWKNIIQTDSVDGYALSFVQDIAEPNLMFLGTERGLYISVDKGNEWTKWTENFPTAAVSDLVIQPEYNDLVIGTFGRAAYIIDNIEPLRQLAHGTINLESDKFKLFPVPPAYQFIYKRPAGKRFLAEAEFRGDNIHYGAMITFLFNPDSVESSKTKLEMEGNKKNSKESKLKIEIVNENGDVIRTLNSKPKTGINRIYWSLNRKGVLFPGQTKPKNKQWEPSGPQVLPGNYYVRLSYKSFKDSSLINVKIDPRINVSLEDLILRDKMLTSLMDKISTAADAENRIKEAEKTVGLIKEMLKDIEDSSAVKIKKLSTGIIDSLKSLDYLIIQKKVQGIRRDENKVGAKLRNAYGMLNSFTEPVADREKITVKSAEESLSKALIKINDFFESFWLQFRNEVEKSGISLFKDYKEFEM